jgi:YHS domain-containing protein
MKYLTPALAAVAVPVALALSGCGAATQAPSISQPPAAHGDHDHPGSSQSDMEKMKAALAKLSPEDAASAEKQHMCPVSGEMLGTMGAPQKVTVNGQQVWICCDGCKDKLLENPDKYLAKLKKD